MTPLHLPARAGRDRIVSISGAPYDGYPAPHMLDSLASIGATHVEPAFIVGYTEPFDESALRTSAPSSTRAGCRMPASPAMPCPRTSTSDAPTPWPCSAGACASPRASAPR